MEFFFKAIILGIVEGITEFLPISSTGHLIIVNQFLDFKGDFAKMFDIVIQLGAILSVVVYFWRRIYPFGSGSSVEQRKEIWATWKKVITGVLPAIVIGGMLGHKIQESLFNPVIVASALFIGGVLLLVVENQKRRSTFLTIADLNYRVVILIGLFQCLAMIPGTSRAAATIIGAMMLGASRSVAVEFSFFLAIPTMIAASCYSLLTHRVAISGSEWTALGIGFAVSFVVALGVIAFFMNYIRKRDFKLFAYYRIILAVIIGVLLYANLFGKV
jgi:undecaprenyl-diphosphatase